MIDFVGCVTLFMAISLACIFIHRKSKQGRVTTDDWIKLFMVIAVITAIVFF